jgi:hypothetical protein
MGTWQRALSGAAVVLLVGACDPVVTMYVRQPLGPAPATACVAAALARSPEVEWVSRPTRDGSTASFEATLRDSTLRGGFRYTTIAFAAPPDSTGVVTMRFAWAGRVTHPPASEERIVGALAGRIFAGLRARCAPDAPHTFECVYGTGKRAKSCAPAT